MSTLDFTAPAPITADHELAGFNSGEPFLNEWLKKRAFKNHASGASRCFVLCAGADVIGYYSLSAGAISHEAAPKTMRRNMPNPLLVLLLGQLAVDKRYHNQGIGQALLRDAMRCYGQLMSPVMPVCLPYWFMRFPIKPSSSIFHAVSWNRLCSR